MVQVTELGYMGIGVKDIAAWKDFATTVVGLELVDEGERDRCYLRMDYWHHRLILHEDRADDVLYLGDVDLSSFGPYYGDAWSSLEDFERTLRDVRRIEARWYATFHHIGVLGGRAAFVERLDRFAAVIERREQRLLEFLSEPRTLDEIAAHRFVYRPQDAVAFAAAVERRSMAQHVERLVRDGRVEELEPGRYRRRR